VPSSSCVSRRSRALTDTVKGLYIPYWTFDAQVHADWTAESGYYYYETDWLLTYHYGARAFQVVVNGYQHDCRRVSQELDQVQPRRARCRGAGDCLL